MAVASDSAIGAALGGARISVVGTALGATSASDGRYRIVGVPAGRATLRVRLLRYRSVDLPVVVADGDTTRADVALRPEPQLLSTVETRARAEDAELFIARPNIGVTTLGAETMNAIPTVGEPDVARTVQLLPGVISRNDFNTGLIVHGGEADQNLVLLDGYPVHNPFHLGGLFSTFMDATVGRIELMSSALPARFGGRLSSVLDVRSAEDARRGVHLTADVSALAATGVLSGALRRGSRHVEHRRRAAPTPMRCSRSSPTTSSRTTSTTSRARVTYALPGGVRLAVTAYAGNDVLDANLAEFAADSLPTKAANGTWALDWGNRVLGVVVAKDFGARAARFGWRIGGQCDDRAARLHLRLLAHASTSATARRASAARFATSASAARSCCAATSHDVGARVRGRHASDVATPRARRRRTPTTSTSCRSPSRRRV